MKLTAAQEQAYKNHRQALLDQQTTLGQMLEKCGTDSDLKAGIQSLTDSINAQLAKLPPLEQVPAAMELAEQVNWFQSCLNNCSEYATRLFQRLSDVNTRLLTANTEVNGFNKKIADGELLPKARHIELCAAEVKVKTEEAVKPLLEEIVLRRKEFVELNKWPMPSDDLLKKPMAEFNAAVETVKKNIEEGKKHKMELNGRGDKGLRANLWKEATEFNAAIEQLAELSGSAPLKKKVTLGNGRPEQNEDVEEVTTKKSGLFPL